MIVAQLPLPDEDRVDAPLPWEVRVAKGLNVDYTPRIGISLRAWAASEGITPSWNNPLGTTMDCCGGRSVNSHGVKHYPTIGDGVRATVRTLKLDYYRDIVAALRSNAPYGRIWLAINQSPWCRGCQDGLYPVVLYNYVNNPQDVSVLADPPPKNQAVNEADWSHKVRITGDRLERPHKALEIAGRNLRQIVRRRRD